jgi:transposase
VRAQGLPAIPGEVAAPLIHAFKHGVPLHHRPADATDLKSGGARSEAAKAQQKISGLLRSERVTRDRYAIRGYISILAKHGADVLTAIHDALTGNPWMPPIPDPP